MKKQRLGEILVQSGIATEDQINRALQMQVGGNRRLGRILIKLGYVNEDQLLDTLSRQMEKTIDDLSLPPTSHAKTVVPRYLCRKYSVVPMAVEEGRVLKLAMLDPSDDDAIADIETYTGMVVMPVLAHQQAIARCIEKHIPFSFKDLFNPQISGPFLKAVYASVIIMACILSYGLYDMWQKELHGTESVSGQDHVYKYSDLMVVAEPTGKIRLFGHGAFSPGLYDVQFDDYASFNSFVEKKKEGFSEKQNKWFSWLIKNRLNRNVAAVAKS